MAMQFHLDVEKMIQAAAAVLRTESSREMSYLRLLKLLYIADRECLRETGRPIVGGRQVAMDWGPVPSRPYDAIKGCDSCLLRWQDFIECSGYKVRLVHDPGMDRLTKYEAYKLAEVVGQNVNLNEWELSASTHEFPEYIKHEPPKGSKEEIPWEDIAEAVGLSEKLPSLQRYEQERAAAFAALKRA